MRSQYVKVAGVRFAAYIRSDENSPTTGAHVHQRVRGLDPQDYYIAAHAGTAWLTLAARDGTTASTITAKLTPQECRATEPRIFVITGCSRNMLSAIFFSDYR